MRNCPASPALGLMAICGHTLNGYCPHARINLKWDAMRLRNDGRCGDIRIPRCGVIAAAPRCGQNRLLDPLRDAGNSGLFANTLKAVRWPRSAAGTMMFARQQVVSVSTRPLCSVSSRCLRSMRLPPKVLLGRNMRASSSHANVSIWSVLPKFDFCNSSVRLPVRRVRAVFSSSCSVSGYKYHRARTALCHDVEPE